MCTIFDFCKLCFYLEFPFNYISFLNVFFGRFATNAWNICVSHVILRYLVGRGICQTRVFNTDEDFNTIFYKQTI